MESTDSDLVREAQYWFGRVHAPDFSAEERRSLEAWLADPRHYGEFERLYDSWRSPDIQLPAFTAAAGTVATPIVRPPLWKRVLIHGSITFTAFALGYASWLISMPVTTRLHETLPGQYLAVAATPDIDIMLDADSSIAVTNSQPLRIELLRGNAYFDARGGDLGKLEVKVGNVRIKDAGTRFSVGLQTDGGSVAVAEGRVEIEVETGTYWVNARERADFDGMRVTGQRMIAEREVAPWRHAQW